MEFLVSNNTAIDIRPFETMTALAEELLPVVTSGSVALSGGSTYRSLCSEWGKSGADLSRGWYCAVDERVVPFEHEESNWGAISKLFLEPCGVPEQAHNHYRTPGYLETLLRNRFDTEPYCFDTIFLGVGDDGHTASLFPGTVAVNNTDDTVLTTLSPKGVTERITMAPKLFAQADQVILIIAGDSKENVVHWLAERRVDLPFLSVLVQREKAIIYMERPLFSLFQSRIS